MGKELLEKAKVVRDAVQSLGFDTLKSCSQITPLVTVEDGVTLRLSEFLGARGIKAPAIRPPTVPKATSRIRFSVHAGLSSDDIGHCIECLREWKKANG